MALLPIGLHVPRKPGNAYGLFQAVMQIQEDPEFNQAFRMAWHFNVADILRSTRHTGIMVECISLSLLRMHLRVTAVF